MLNQIKGECDKMKRTLCLLLAGLLLASVLSGCGKTKKREQVTIAFWGDQLTETYGEYLRDRFPDVEFTFYAANNSTDFYRFKEEKGDLPDILTVRRFALRDVACLKDALMDLSDTELVNTFHQAYLHNYTYSDGTVNWLPACAEVDGILVNKTLLEDNGLSIPKNYKEFVEVCAALKELGIRPFRSNFSADFTCMEVLQGLSIEQLNSQTGRAWRQQYESGQTDQISEDVWLPVFERMEEFIEYADIRPADTENGSSVFDEYTDGQTAMIRGTSEDAERYSGDGQESVLVPYYGTSEEDNWYLTYPAFQAAASARAEESPERKALILDILSAMLDEDGLQSMSTRESMISYNKNVATALSPVLSNLQPYVDNNRLYIRLASADMFAVSQSVVQGMITGKYPDARAAFGAFNVSMGQSDTQADTAAHIDRGYSYAFDPKKGSQAASAIMSSVREELGVELLMGQSINVAGNITEGDYTEAELRYLTQGEAIDILLCSMTGEQLEQYVDYVLNTPEKRGSVINDSTLYVSSGFEMELTRTDTGYEVERLTVGGKEPDKKAVYTMAVLGSEILMQKEALEAAGITEYTRPDTDFKQIIAARLSDGKQLAAPTDYITLR